MIFMLFIGIIIILIGFILACICLFNEINNLKCKINELDGDILWILNHLNDLLDN
jgi:hypothetical protein